MTTLDRLLPVWEFGERHEIVVRATPDAVDRAFRAVTLAELPVARALFWLRLLPRRGGGEDNGDPRAPLVDEMRRGGFEVLLDAPGHELVLGVERPDSYKAVINFRIDSEQAARCVLSTETRVHADRSFARYWFVIRPFSALIRILFLRAARRRAEAGP